MALNKTEIFSVVFVYMDGHQEIIDFKSAHDYVTQFGDQNSNANLLTFMDVDNRMWTFFPMTLFNIHTPPLEGAVRKHGRDG